MSAAVKSSIEKLYRISEAADLLGISTRHLRDLINEGEVIVIRLGEGSRADRIEESELQRFIMRRRVNRGMVNHYESRKGIWFDDPWAASGYGPTSWLRKNLARFLLTDRAIIAGAIAYTGRELFGQGVYFLIKEGAIVYVGQSGCAGSRLQDHSFDKAFDHVFFIPEIPRTWLETIERYYIHKLTPSLNRWRPSAPPRAITNILNSAA